MRRPSSPSCYSSSAVGSVEVTLPPLPSPSPLASTRYQLHLVHTDVVKYTWGGCLVFVSLSSAWIANTWQVQMLHYGRVINSPSCHSWLAALQLLGTHGSSRYGAKGRAPHSATLPSFIRSHNLPQGISIPMIEIRQWHSRHQWTRCQTPILTRLQLSTESRLFDTGLGGQLRCVSCSEQHGTSAFIRLFAL
ncbi:hypothetical protein EV401DRAFT_1911841 [Pisolithus croceorrhizus]|nr:hypothetical protein EV401DRAFT_1911841 [Pisolithus croceorrhizus]